MIRKKEYLSTGTGGTHSTPALTPWPVDSGQYTPNKKNVDIHKSYYRVLNHFFSSNQFLNTVHKVIKREQLFVFRCVSISINSKFTYRQTYIQTNKQTLSRVYSKNPM